MNNIFDNVTVNATEKPVKFLIKGNGDGYTIDDMRTDIIDALKKKGFDAEGSDVYKNNNTLLKGITTHNETCVAPNIYLEPMFDSYQNGEKSLAEITEEIIRIYRNSSDKISVSADFLKSWDSVRDNLFAQVIGKNTNPEILNSNPYKEVPGVNDLVMIFRIKIPEFSASPSIATALLSNSLLREYGKTVEDLYTAACENVERLFPTEALSMSEVLRKMYRNSGMPEEVIDMMCAGMDDEIPMILISNTSKLYGAANVFAYGNETLKNLSDIYDSDLIILPSSIHECIALPYEKAKVNLEKNPDAYITMVKEVNATQVSPEERLTDNVYFFSRENGLSVFAA